MIEVKGKCGISAKIVLDSISPEGVRLTTMEIEYPRLILAELNTHRMLSKNSASSRAIPFEKMKETLNGCPVRFGAANKGMQDTGRDHNSLVVIPTFDEAVDGGYTIPALFIEGTDGLFPEDAWEEAKYKAIEFSKAFKEAGYHKQVYNRLTEPFQMMKTVISGTEWANFFWLRNDSAADPTLQELARCMQEAMNQSIPQELNYGEWHLPYVHTWYDDMRKEQNFEIGGEDDDSQLISLEDAIKVSCARSCAVSFRNIDYGLEKSREVYERLVGDERKHSSALEHAAKVMSKTLTQDGNHYLNQPDFRTSWEKGISHADRDGQLWSGNFRGFIQHRKTIVGENHNKWDMKN